MKTYPIMLDIRDRLAVVVGGGAVGLRKVRSLTRAGARVKLVTEAVAGEADLAGVDVVGEPYRSEFLEGATLVFACTDSRAVNAQIAADARRAGAIVNAADQPEDCDFYLPAVVADGDVIVAVGTGGCSPALAADLKRRIAAEMPERIGEFAAILGGLREKLKQTVPDGRRREEITKRLAEKEIYEAFRNGGSEAVEGILELLMKE